MTTKTYQDGGSWRRLNGIVGLFIILGCFIVVSGTELNLPSDSDLVRARNGGIGVYADEGDGGSGNSTGGGGGGTKSESTPAVNCGSDADCCYQYTWLGFRETIPAGPNATCEFLKKEMRDETLACYDPLVFTTKIGEQEPKGTPPDFDILEQYAESNNWGIYCRRSGKSCITYTHYSGTDMINQTRFCGFVTNQNSNKRVNDGCYKQNAGGGTVREVCVCNKHKCGKPSSSNLPPTFKITWITIIAVITCRFGATFSS